MFAIERLPPPDPASEPPRRPSLFHLLLAREDLARDAPVERARRRRGIASLLLAPEPLPLDPPAPPRRRSPWLRWLLRPESIGSEQAAPQHESPQRVGREAVGERGARGGAAVDELAERGDESDRPH